MATRQTSSSGRPKSPRIQVVLPEELCLRLTALAEGESRTVSNMAKVLIQQGVERLEAERGGGSLAPGTRAASAAAASPEQFRQALEQRERSGGSQRLRGAPRRLRLQRPR